MTSGWTVGGGEAERGEEDRGEVAAEVLVEEAASDRMTIKSMPIVRGSPKVVRRLPQTTCNTSHETSTDTLGTSTSSIVDSRVHRLKVMLSVVVRVILSDESISMGKPRFEPTRCHAELMGGGSGWRQKVVVS